MMSFWNNQFFYLSVSKDSLDLITNYTDYNFNVSFQPYYQRFSTDWNGYSSSEVKV
jgi:hypothetical protein